MCAYIVYNIYKRINKIKNIYNNKNMSIIIHCKQCDEESKIIVSNENTSYIHEYCESLLIEWNNKSKIFINNTVDDDDDNEYKDEHITSETLFTIKSNDEVQINKSIEQNIDFIINKIKLLINYPSPNNRFPLFQSIDNHQNNTTKKYIIKNPTIVYCHVHLKITILITIGIQ